MKLKILFSRRTLSNISEVNRGISSLQQPYTYCRNGASASSSRPHSRTYTPANRCPDHAFLHFNSHFKRFLSQGAILSEFYDDQSENDSEEDATVTEFLSRFVWIMRGKLSEVYPVCDKDTINGMLLIIVEKVVAEIEKGGLEHMLGGTSAAGSEDFSEDLWKTVWDVSNVVLDDMQKAQKKEKMKGFLQSEEVKEMCRFAGEIGIRGDMLRELRFKWAREKMEESEFYQSLERLREEYAQASAREKSTRGEGTDVGADDSGDITEEKTKVVSLPKRHGKIKYKIYGLDLSDPRWAEVADKIQSGDVMWPQEPKPISGKCKIVTEKILSLQEEDDPSPLLAEWVELLQPSRIDWIALLDKLKQKNYCLYLKIAELVLGEQSFQPNTLDYSKLIDAHAKENHLEDAERILNKMKENGILPDILMSSVLVHMYCKAGKLDLAKGIFESMKKHGFQPDMKVYNSMIMAFVNSGQPKLGESLMRELEANDIKLTLEIYMALLRSFAQCGDVNGAQRIATTMHFAGFEPNVESCTLLVEAFGRGGDADQARHNFDYIIKLGYKPDDRSTASMIAAYKKDNLLDKALDLLLQLKKDGFEPGIATYMVLVDWLGKLQLIDEAEQILNKIAELGEVPPFDLHVILCDMYSRAGNEKKALQALGVVEAKKDQLGKDGYERIIDGLIAGGFEQDAVRINGLMEARGFKASESIKVKLKASRIFAQRKQPRR